MPAPVTPAPGYDPMSSGNISAAPGGLGDFASRMFFGGPLMRGEMPLNTVLSMIHRQQEDIAVQQASTDSKLIEQASLNFMTAVRGPGATPGQVANMQRLAGEIAPTISSLWGSVVSNPMAYNFAQRNAPFLGHFGPFAQPILAKGAFGAMRGLPGGAMTFPGTGAADLAGRLQQAAVLPSGHMNMAFTAGLGAFGISSLMNLGARFGVDPRQLGNVQALNSAGARLGGMMNLPAGQAMGQFTAQTGALQQLGPGGLASFAGDIQAASLMAGDFSGRQGIAGTLMGAQMAQRQGLMPITGALLAPRAFGSTPYALNAQGMGFGTLGPGQMEAAMLQRGMAGVASPAGTAVGGMFQAIQTAAQGQGVGGGGPMAMLKALGAGSATQQLVSEIMSGDLSAGTREALTNPAQLAAQLSGLGLSNATVMQLLTTPTPATQGLAAQYGQSALQAGQNAAISESILQPAITQGLERAGIGQLGGTITGALASRMLAKGAQDPGQIASMMGSILQDAGRHAPGGGALGQAAAEIYNISDLALQGQGLPGISTLAGMSAGGGAAKAMSSAAIELSRLNELLSQHFNLKAGVGGRILVDLGTEGGIEGARAVMGAMSQEELSSIISRISEFTGKDLGIETKVEKTKRVNSDTGEHESTSTSTTHE